jgi:thioesterase domain-containing protein
VQPRGPYLLGGWCTGGIVAFEMARQLQRQGQKVALLVLIDSSAPIPAPRPANVDRAALLTWFLLDLGDRFERDLAVSVDELRALEPDKQLSYVLERTKLFDAIPADVELEQFQHVFQVYVANLQASRSYLPSPYSGRIVLFQAEQAMRKADQGNFRKHEINWGTFTSWQEFSTEAIETYTIPGNHYTMLTKPNVQILAQRLTKIVRGG